MKPVKIAILAVFCLLTSPPVHSAPDAANASPKLRAQFRGLDGNRRGGVFPDANQCAPVYARPVWGPHSELLGYSCSNYANGS
jgi:hypothetical protein